MGEPTKIGKYDILGVLGKGGMGVVYKGFDASISRPVAIKVVTKASVDPNELHHVLTRFRHEAQAVGKLPHPRITQIYEYGEDENIAYIAMEFVNGKTLEQHLMQNERYSFREVGEIVRQLLDAMGFAHGQGVVHRDIKPSNILINDDGRIKISDFGIARLSTSNLTQTGDVLGTPNYMAPEQFLGAEADGRADLFAIGVIAYELLTNRKPFDGNSAAVMQKVLNERPPDATQLEPRLSPLVNRVLQTALAKNRDERFATARDFSEAFAEAIDATLKLGDVASAPAPVPDTSALLNAARLLNAGLPAAQAAAPASAAGIPDLSTIVLDTSVRKACLLVIDDEERILNALRSLFRSRYHVFATTDGYKALEFMRKYHMHVIISDQRMPVMPGVELLRQSRDISPRSVRILLTGYSDLAAIVGSINDGEVYRFISKPWDNNDLRTIVAEAVTIGLELADRKAPVIELPEKMEAGVLVVGKDEEIFRVTRELIAGRCPVHYGADIDSALAVMQNQEIAVVVTSVESGHDQLISMLKLLKQEDPQILTIVVTAASDSELVIELINQAQIFRFLNKPVNIRLLKGHVVAALQRYLAFKQSPELTGAHRVQRVEQVSASSVGRRILEGIKSLRGRWFGRQ